MKMDHSTIDPRLGACIPRDEWHISTSEQNTINHCSIVCKPEEWVAYKYGEDMILARIFCPILTHNLPEDYIIWASDRETREIKSSLLYRVMVMVPSDDEDVDGGGHARLPLLTTPTTQIPTTHLPSHSNQIVHENSLRPNSSKLQDLNSLTTTAPRRDEAEGKRWLCQARVDYLACCILLDSVGKYPTVCCNACFMAHEAAEKSLKAGRYITCGMSDPTELIHHQLRHHAYALISLLPELTKRLQEHASYLEPFYLKTRFPNQYQQGVVPFQKFTREDAMHAKYAAEQIWETVYHIFQHFNVPVEALSDK